MMTLNELFANPKLNVEITRRLKRGRGQLQFLARTPRRPQSSERLLRPFILVNTAFTLSQYRDDVRRGGAKDKHVV